MGMAWVSFDELVALEGTYARPRITPPMGRHQVKPSTFESYRRNIEHHAIPALGSRLLRDLGPVQLNALYTHLLKDGRRNGPGGLHPKTVRYIHTIVHKALADALDAGLITTNVAERAKPPKPRASGPSEIHFWKPDDLRRFFDLIAGHRLEAAWHVSAMTGMRRGEVLGLRWGDIDFDNDRVTVRQALMQLEAEGLIFRENRRGWFVSPPRIRYDPTANASFTESVTEQGRVAGTTVLSTEQIAASTWESNNLSCAVGDPIFLIRRLRSVDGRAVLIEHLHIKAERCPDLLEFPLDRSLTELMAEKYGIIERRTRINMRPTALPEPHAQALGVVAGTASLYLSRIIHDQFDEAIEFDQEFWRHDALDIWVEVGR